MVCYGAWSYAPFVYFRRYGRELSFVPQLEISPPPPRLSNLITRFYAETEVNRINVNVFTCMYRLENEKHDRAICKDFFGDMYNFNIQRC